MLLGNRGHDPGPVPRAGALPDAPLRRRRTFTTAGMAPDPSTDVGSVSVSASATCLAA
ncbi:MAG: hypothetical protein R2695_21280 [Acidimicrobiales bacterium]